MNSVKAPICKVLVVDDDANLRGVLAADLRDRGYVVMVARNGSEALDRLETFAPAVIVLDLMMPVMDGWTFMRRYRDRKSHSCVPVIAMSALADVPVRDEGRGFTTFLRKPFDLDELENCIAQLTRPGVASSG